jgi:hypothetical protein
MGIGDLQMTELCNGKKVYIYNEKYVKSATCFTHGNRINEHSVRLFML